MPSPDVTYTLRSKFYVQESKYGTEAYLYDYFSLRIKNSACADFNWTPLTFTDPADFTYYVYPTHNASEASRTKTVALPTVASTTCDDSPTVTWYYKEVGGSIWSSLSSSHHMVLSTSSTTVIFNGHDWNWGDVFEGKVRQHIKVKYVAADPTTAIMEAFFDVIYVNQCYNDALSSFTSEATDISYTFLNTYDTAVQAVVDSTASTASWSVSNCDNIWNLEILDETIPEWKTTGMNDTSIFNEDNSCNNVDCTFAIDYPWMGYSAHSSFTGYSNRRVRIDTGGTGDDNNPLVGLYMFMGPVTYQLRWWHYSPRSYSSTATDYDYFDVVITYECDDDQISITT